MNNTVPKRGTPAPVYDAYPYDYPMQNGKLFQLLPTFSTAAIQQQPQFVPTPSNNINNVVVPNNNNVVVVHSTGGRAMEKEVPFCGWKSWLCCLCCPPCGWFIGCCPIDKRKEVVYL